MDKKIVDFIKNYHISSIELEDIKTISPLLDIINYDQFIENCNILQSFGYPKSDLDILLMGNPNIFVEQPNVLRNSLKNLTLKYKDLEQTLKENPNII